MSMLEWSGGFTRNESARMQSSPLHGLWLISGGNLGLIWDPSIFIVDVEHHDLR